MPNTSAEPRPATPSLVRSLPRSVRAIIIVVVAIAAVVSVGWAVDAGIAARTEHRIAEDVRDAASLEQAPRVWVSGAPYLAALATSEIEHVGVDMLDIVVPGLGMVNARTDVNGVQVTREQVLSGNLEGAPAELFRRTIRMDGVAIGSRLGMTDLDIAHPRDISPTGGSDSEAVFTGTPEGMDEQVSVLVSLRMRGSVMAITPVSVLDAPAEAQGRENEIMDAFAWEVDTRSLPLSDRAMAVYLAGGSIHVESQTRNVELTARDLSPLGAPEGEGLSGEGTEGTAAEQPH